MTIIGITGLIGAGKSTVCRILEKQTGADVLDADRIAKDLIKQHGIDNKGVIGDNAKLDEVEQNLKPYFIKYCSDLKKKNAPGFIIMDVPLLYEYGLEAYCDYVVNVYCDEKTRETRVRQRKHPDMETFAFLNGRQKKTDVRMEKADFSVCTDGAERDVERKTMEVVAKIIEKERAKPKPARIRRNTIKTGKPSKDRG